MKYSKFIQSVRDLGYRVDDIGKFLYVTTTTGYPLIAINKAKAYSVNSTYDRFDSMLPDDDKKALLALACELAITPLDEREDEEKYRLKIPLMGDSGYLNIENATGRYYITNKSETARFRTVFTRSELNELKTEHNLDSFVMEEVKDDE